MKQLSCLLVIAMSLGAGAVAQGQTVQELVQKAMASRDLVKAAKTDLEAAIKAARSAGAYPTTRLETGFASRPDVSGGEDFTLFQPVDIFGKSSAARSVAYGAVLSSEAGVRDAMLTVEGDVLGALASYAAAGRDLATAQELLTIAEGVDKATKRLVEERALPENQSIRSGLEVEASKQAVVDAEAGVKSAMLAVQAAVGVTTAPGEVPGGGIGPVVVEDGAELETNRPELFALVADQKTAEAEARQASLDFYPDLEIQARRSPWSSDQEQYGARLQWVIPLWDHGASRNRRNDAKLRASAAGLRIQDKKKQIQAEIDTAVISMKAAESAVTAYQKLVDGASDLMAKTQKGFELGANTLIDVLDAKRALADAKSLLSSAMLRQDESRAALVTAQGQVLGEVTK